MQPEKQESTWLYDALGWLEFNRNRLVGLGVVGLALVVAGYIYVWNLGQSELKANQALLALKPIAGPDEDEKAASAAEFLRVAAEYPSSGAAERALLLAAGDLYRNSRYAEAEAQFQKLLDQDRRGPLASMAALGVASSLDAQDKVEAAISAYQFVTAEYANTPAAARAKFALALLHETRNEPEEALKIYDSLMAARNLGRAPMEAAVKRDALLKLHPELAKTNAPAALAPGPFIGLTNTAGATNAAGTPTNKIAGQP